MCEATDYDVIIIGTGAGGGTLAHRLAPTGKRILLLERGGYLPRERDNWDAQAVFVEGKYTAPEEWLDKDGKEFQPGTHYYVGGNTKVYGAALFRLREKDFGELVHHGGRSPAWPLSYQDFAPYYTQAERLYRIRGERGIDPTDPPSEDPYPYPALTHEPRIQQLYDDLVRAGHRPFPLPLGVRRDAADPRHSHCIRCCTCDGFPCLVHAKSDAEVLCVEPALASQNVTLLTGAKVTRLETDPSGRVVTKVIVERDGQREEYSAHVVVASGGAVNSAALLLRSKSHQHSNGLANGSDMVGRHYMCHLNTAALAISRAPNPTVFQKTLGLNDFYFGADDWDYPLGHIQMLGKTEGAILRPDAPALVPGFALDQLAKHAIDFWLITEDLPDPNNRVRIDEEDRIILHYTPNNGEAHQRLNAKMHGLLGQIGCTGALIPHALYAPHRVGIKGVAHQCGTARFGSDPRTSVLDLNCKAHDLDNLYVVDGSFFPSSSAVNPGLTIMANALRVGDHLQERLA